MGLFSAPPVAAPPPPPPAANPAQFASGATLGNLTRPNARPWGGTDLTSGTPNALIGKTMTASLGLAPSGAPPGSGTPATGALVPKG